MDLDRGLPAHFPREKPINRPLRGCRRCMLLRAATCVSPVTAKSLEALSPPGWPNAEPSRVATEKLEANLASSWIAGSADEAIAKTGALFSATVMVSISFENALEAAAIGLNAPGVPTIWSHASK